MSIECKYITEDGVCLLKSLYVAGHERHVHPDFCRKECGPETTHKLGMLNNQFHEILTVLPEPEEAERMVLEKRAAFQEKRKQERIIEASLTDEAKDLGKTIIESGKRILSGQSPIVPSDEKDRRQAICLSCDKYSQEKERCTLCGCFMNIKNWVLDGHCKLGKWDSRLVSVLLPHRQENPVHVENTIASIRKSAKNPIEILHGEDTGMGKRALVNQMAKDAKGDFLFILDAHCAVSDNWDGLMKFVCGDKDLVNCTLSGIKEKEWQTNGGNHYLCYLTPGLREKWWKQGEGSLSLTMGLTGCGMMLKRKRFWELGGYFPNTFGFGAEGPEWACKIWLSGGKCIVRRDVICAHLFRDKTPYSMSGRDMDTVYEYLNEQVYNKKLPLQDRSIEWLAGKFEPVPGWFGEKA